MIISKMILKDFRNIKNSTIIFNKGLNSIIGANGSGKTTILQAIVLQLFNYAEFNLEDYISWGADSFEIYMEWSHLGFVFKQYIKYNNRKLSERDLYIDNNYFKNSDAVKELANIFNPKLSMSAMVSMEQSIDLITIRPAERRELLKQIYELDFSKQVSELDLEIKQLDIQLIELEKEIYHSNCLSFNETNIEIYPFDKDTFENKKELLNKLNVIKKDYDLNSHRILLLEENTNKAKNEIELNNTLIQNARNGLNTYTDSYNSQVATLKKSIDNFNSLEKNQDNSLELKKINESIKENSAQIKRLKLYDENHLDNLIQEKTNIENKINLEESGTCPTCEHAFEKNNSKGNLLENKQALDLITLKINNFKNEKLTYEKDLENQRNIKSTIDILKQKEIIEKNKIESSKKEIALKINNLEKELSNIELNLKNKIHDTNLLIRMYEESITTNKTLYANLIQEKEKLENIRDNYEDLNIITNLENDIASYVSIIEKNKLIGEHNEKIKSEKVLNEQKKTTYESQKINLNDDIEVLKKSKIVLQKELPNYIISNIIESLENDLNEFIDSIYFDHSYKIKIVEKKDTISIMYGDGVGNWRDCTQASGFEKQLFSLAWKIGLSNRVGSSFLILDEAESQSDVLRSLELYRIIASLNLDQILVITHKPETQDMLSNEYGARIFEAKNNEIMQLN